MRGRGVLAQRCTGSNGAAQPFLSACEPPVAVCRVIGGQLICPVARPGRCDICGQLTTALARSVSGSVGTIDSRIGVCGPKMAGQGIDIATVVQAEACLSSALDVRDLFTLEMIFYRFLDFLK
ncbi:hypothetical protein RRG08_009160 [Elysia crispata]|uniref:Uncharacterized protein n=1 Tax=Elysia crispata TaxID=231223 RepID=A0AAE1B4V0_9GAST|nr:hypothetical protein RRG08_009160 [Elysia crispata]